MYDKNKNLPAIRSDSGYTPFEIAIRFRNTKMAECLYPLTPLEFFEENEYVDILVEAIHADTYGATKDFITYYIDDEGNNILHLAGKLAPPSRLNTISAGPALQMQRELLWFKVRNSHGGEEDCTAFLCSYENKEGKTPWELFTVEHENLRRAGEKRMKDRATSCMVCGNFNCHNCICCRLYLSRGNKEETGAPIFLIDGWFTIFVIYDDVAMFSSTASIMMFLSILISRYGEDDFLFSLPAKLMVGLIALFASIVCTILTFSTTFYKEEKQGILSKFVAILAMLPITLYAVLNCRLWISLIDSTCWESRFMFRPGKHRLFDGDQDID
ncbi:Hypothetical predicted protein [Olea europaea subsp. europaea]|uniref:PGG domain-containing protein n=1 Tax=Olea europaea subsp. europaea TaxID=158383 RepID=A0A8S0QF83_OLEEU|nr:Hypothetical predicted protein [Olea europaea subsp. europaea]